MRNRFLAFLGASALAFAACTGGGSSAAPTSGGGATPGETTGGEATPGGSPAGGGFDPASVSGDITLGAWESSPAEGKALKSALDAFAAKYPNIKIKQETVAGDYRAQMVNRFNAKDEPDIFYVNAEYTPEWIREEFLEPLDPFISKQGFDTSAFFPAYADIFKGPDGQRYGLPKDGNTIAMAYNTDLVPNPPATMDDLLKLANGLKGKSGLKAPMCLNSGLDRGLAFLYAQGGSLLTEDNKAAAIDQPQSKTALQWYMDLFKNGLGQTNTQLGDSWCGEALGKGDVAIAFEGGWLYGYMKDTYPNVKWTFAEMPTGSSGQKATITYTAAYGIGPDSDQKDAAWVALQYLTGPEGMAKWTEGGIALPSRKDVTVPQGFEAIVAGVDYAKAGSGFMPGYPDVQKAFQDAFTKEITDKSYGVDSVISATKAKIDQVLAQ